MQTPIPTTPTPTTPISTPPVERIFHPRFMVGFSDNRFAPGAQMTRAQAVAILTRIQLLNFEVGIDHLPPGMESFDAFADVRAEHWFYYYLAWAYDAGFIQGSNGYFRPSDPVTRQELAAMIVRSDLRLPETTQTGTAGFVDANRVSNWARGYVYIAYRNHLILGDGNGYFRPRDSITRAEAATVFNRLLGRINNRSMLYYADTPNLNDARDFHDVRNNAWYFGSILAATNDHYSTSNNNGLINWMLIIYP